LEKGVRNKIKDQIRRDTDKPMDRVIDYLSLICRVLIQDIYQ
jgi:hypothetical protein